MTSSNSALRNGQDVTEQYSSDVTIGVTGMKNATRADDVHLLGQTTHGTKLLFEPQLREELTALIIPYTARQLAKFSGATPEGARHWADGSRCPKLHHAFSIAQSLPTVRDWVALRCGIERVMQAHSWDVWVQGLYTIAGGVGPDADKARWAITRLTAPEVTEVTVLRDSLALHDRREAQAVAVEKEKSAPAKPRRRA